MAACPYNDLTEQNNNDEEEDKDKEEKEDNVPIMTSQRNSSNLSIVQRKKSDLRVDRRGNI